MKASIKDKHVLRLIAIAGLLMVLVGLAYVAYRMSQPCLGLVNPGCPGPTVLLTEQGSWINSPTSLTIEIMNVGRQSTVLSSYYIKDSIGQQYAAPGWIGPTIPVNAPMNVTFTIDGKDFTFQRYSSYTVTLDASQNYYFTFSVFT